MELTLDYLMINLCETEEAQSLSRGIWLEEEGNLGGDGRVKLEKKI